MIFVTITVEKLLCTASSNCLNEKKNSGTLRSEPTVELALGSINKNNTIWK